MKLGLSRRRGDRHRVERAVQVADVAGEQFGALTAPPGSDCASRTSTSQPASASVAAATNPLCPAPMTTASAARTAPRRHQGPAPRQWPASLHVHSRLRGPPANCRRSGTQPHGGRRGPRSSRRGTRPRDIDEAQRDARLDRGRPFAKSTSRDRPRSSRRPSGRRAEAATCRPSGGWCYPGPASPDTRRAFDCCPPPTAHRSTRRPARPTPADGASAISHVTLMGMSLSISDHRGIFQGG